MIQEFVDAVMRSGGSVTRHELLIELRRVMPGVQPAQVERAVQQCSDLGRITVDGDRIVLVAPVEHYEAPLDPQRALRVVAFDIESILRPTHEPPEFKEARIFQLAAVRFGRDKQWCHEQRSFNAYVDLPDEDWEIHSARARELWGERHRPMADVLENFRAFSDGADFLVAYNGTGVDFPLLTAACQREGLAEFYPDRFIDAYYLALALWPTPPRQHRLRDLTLRVGAKASRLQWHDALDDSIMLSSLLAAGARQLRSFSTEFQNLLRSSTSASAPWALLFDLARLAPIKRSFSDADVAEVLSTLLANKAPRRPRPTAAAPATLQLPDSLLVGGHVSPYQLALAAGRHGERRPAQDQMADFVQGWIDRPCAGLVEAPTGTGKSYAMLANALDWLSLSPDHRVIIATFTKQLQAQMAEDIEALSGVVAGLAEASDMVKGQANRLSLRALVTSLADSTIRDPRRRPRVRRVPFANDVRYRELLAYLTMRLGAPATLAEEWEGRSVDSPDMPAFFYDYAPRMALYLHSLSQAAAGDYGATSSDPLVDHTDDVAEAIANHRLIIANHALLLASTDGLGAASADTVLFVDEAHMLEDAATSAMTATLEYGDVEQLPAGVSRWLADAAVHPSLVEISRASHQLELFLDNEMLPRSALPCFDTVSGTPGARTVSLASPRVGALTVRHTASLIGAVRYLERLLWDLMRPLHAYQGSEVFRSADHFAAERFFALLKKVSGTHDAARRIVADAEAILGAPRVGGGAAPVAEEEPASNEPEAEPDDQNSDDVPEALNPSDATLELLDEAPADGESGVYVPPPAPNHVVWAAETGPLELEAGIRRFRFRLSSSPISLPDEPEWHSFLGLIPRTYFVSATLTVAGEWRYIRRRLGIGDGVPAVILDSPFDIATQARLVCFGDFPSWAEHERQAVRTLAWQVGGYVREVVQRNDDDTWSNGAMVLTTSRQVAADVGIELDSVLADEHRRPPLSVATLVGNARAIEAMKAGGGVLVGTRGLWQGVDIADPTRLSLVWINKLPFAPFADPVVAARRALAFEDAERDGALDPELTATEEYYLPLAAIGLRQAVGRLIRSRDHRGIIVISDPKLSGPTRLRQSYRRILLGSLDPGLLRDDPETSERTGGNVVTMAEGWRRIWEFLRDDGAISGNREAFLTTDDALREQCLTPETREILSLALTRDEEQGLRATGSPTLRTELLLRSARIGGLLRGERNPIELKDKQVEALSAVADDYDVLAVLPTGYGKSFAFQLPALVLPGVTIVVSPLVSLMQNQALDLNRSIGGAVRALVAPLSVSNSRLGKAEVADALSGRDDHGIRIVYVSPERLCTRQFQDLVEQGVALGIVRRIAIDEAHTCIQWGDDFRPSFRRFENYLRRLRRDYSSLRITALTATANPTVIEGLRTRLFGLTAEHIGPEESFRFVTANPIRPELAVYRRTLGRGEGGPVTVAGLVEAVLTELDDHAIFYCLTVKEVEALYAQLRNVLGAEGNQRVRRYHGRLNEAEKAAVINEFVDAPKKGDDDFAPMVIVATSAFGLGIDRPDIRCVFVVSPPTDLSALYQQLGRAGRDGSARDVDPKGPSNVALALGTGRGFNLVQWMTQQGPALPLLIRIGQRLLSLGATPTDPEYVTFDINEVAVDQLAADFAEGLLSDAQNASDRTYQEYRSAIASVLSVLGGLNVLEDLGDFPASVKLQLGESPPNDAFSRAVVDALFTSDAPPARSASLLALHRHLTTTVPNYMTLGDEPGATWSLLVDFHALGYLDVSQAPSYGHSLTGMLLTATGSSRLVPAGFADQVRNRQRRAAREMREMRDWYSDTECANVGLANYFNVAELPDEICLHDVARCSTCWGSPIVAASGAPLPAVLRAFNLARPRPAAVTTAGRPLFERNLDEHVEALIAATRQGLTAGLVQLVLRGTDTFFDRRSGHRKPLWPQLLYSRHRGTMPGIQMRDVEDSLRRLADRGAIVVDSDRWRVREYVEREARRAASAAGVA